MSDAEHDQSPNSRLQAVGESDEEETQQRSAGRRRQRAAKYIMKPAEVQILLTMQQQHNTLTGWGGAAAGLATFRQLVDCHNAGLSGDAQRIDTSSLSLTAFQRAYQSKNKGAKRQRVAGSAHGAVTSESVPAAQESLLPLVPSLPVQQHGGQQQGGQQQQGTQQQRGTEERTAGAQGEQAGRQQASGSSGAAQHGQQPDAPQQPASGELHAAAGQTGRGGSSGVVYDPSAASRRAKALIKQAENAAAAMPGADVFVFVRKTDGTSLSFSAGAVYTPQSVHDELVTSALDIYNENYARLARGELTLHTSAARAPRAGRVAVTPYNVRLHPPQQPAFP